VHHLPAVDVDRLAGDVPRMIRGEEDRHGPELRWHLPLASGATLLIFSAAQLS
jgi:hypothetical protein